MSQNMDPNNVKYCCVPTDTCCQWKLQTGAKVVVLIHCMVMMIVIALPFPTMIYDTSWSVDPPSRISRIRKAYAYMTVLHGVVLLIYNLVFLWGVFKKKRLLAFIWLGLTAWWMLMSFFFLLILLGLYYHDSGTSDWVFALIASMIITGVFAYMWWQVYGFWVELHIEAKNINPET